MAFPKLLISLVCALLFSGEEQFKTGEKDIFSLSGEWQFYWEELIRLPEEAKNKAVAMEVPSDWYEWGLPQVTKFGYATYIKRINADNDGSLGLKIAHVFSSYELFINGQSIYKSGIVGRSKAEYEPSREPVVIAIPERFGDEFIIAIQAANYDHLDSGIYYEPIVGSYADLSLNLRIEQGISLFLAGGFFITGFILFGFSLLSRQLELQVFFYALFSLSLMYRMLGATPYPLHSLVPDTNFYLSITLEYLTIHTAALFGGLFVLKPLKSRLQHY